MQTYIKATFDDGDYMITGVNLPELEAHNFYLNCMMNVGTGPADNWKTCIKVETI